MKRFVLEEGNASPTDLDRYVAGKAREHRVRATSLLSSAVETFWSASEQCWMRWNVNRLPKHGLLRRKMNPTLRVSALRF